MRAIDASPSWSSAPTLAQCRRLVDAGIPDAIVGGEAPPPSEIRRYIEAYAAGGLHTGAYGFVRHKTSDPLWSIRRALEGSAGLPIRWFGVDAELPADGVPQAVVVGQIRDAVAMVRRARPDVEPLVYTAAWWWDDVLRGVTDTFGCRGWLAGGPYYDDGTPVDFVPDPAYAETALCGGWTMETLALWQYQNGSDPTFGINADRNLWIAGPGGGGTGGDVFHRHNQPYPYFNGRTYQVGRGYQVRLAADDPGLSPAAVLLELDWRVDPGTLGEIVVRDGSGAFAQVLNRWAPTQIVRAVPGRITAPKTATDPGYDGPGLLFDVLNAPVRILGIGAVAYWT